MFLTLPLTFRTCRLSYNFRSWQVSLSADLLIVGYFSYFHQQDPGYFARRRGATTLTEEVYRISLVPSWVAFTSRLAAPYNADLIREWTRVLAVQNAVNLYFLFSRCAPWLRFASWAVRCLSNPCYTRRCTETRYGGPSFHLFSHILAHFGHQAGEYFARRRGATPLHKINRRIVLLPSGSRPPSRCVACLAGAHSVLVSVEQLTSLGTALTLGPLFQDIHYGFISTVFMHISTRGEAPFRCFHYCVIPRYDEGFIHLFSHILTLLAQQALKYFARRRGATTFT